MMTQINLPRDSDGKLTKYASPGGYPMFYLMSDGESMCPDCANGENGAEPTIDPTDQSGWQIVAADVNWEDSDMLCCHCGKTIESAYGEE